jgi:hypothetical protein
MTDTSVLHMAHGHDGDGRCIVLNAAGHVRPAYDWTTGISKTRAAGDAPNPGVVRCLCCGDDHYGPTLLCSDCRTAGCEESRDSAGELGYWECELPRCIVCGAAGDRCGRVQAAKLAAGHEAAEQAEELPS